MTYSKNIIRQSIIVGLSFLIGVVSTVFAAATYDASIQDRANTLLTTVKSNASKLNPSEVSSYYTLVRVNIASLIQVLITLDASIAGELGVIGVDDTNLIDQVTGTGNTGTGKIENQIASRYPGCSKNDIVGANGKVIAACDDPWRGDWGDGKCAVGYHTPSGREMGDLFAMDRKPEDIGYRFADIANYTIGLTSETNAVGQNVFYNLSDRTIKFDRLKKEFQDQGTPVDFDSLRKALGNEAQNVELHFMQAHTTLSFGNLVQGQNNPFQFKLRCMRDTSATPTEALSTIDKYAYFFQRFNLVLSRAGEIYRMEETVPADQSKNIEYKSIKNKADYLKSMNPNISAEMIEKSKIMGELFFSPLIEFFAKHPEQPFLGTTGEARIEKLKKDFGYMSKVTYSVELPAIARDYVKTTDFTKYIYAVLIANKGSLALTYGDFQKFVSCAEGRCIRKSPEYKFFEEYRTQKNATTIYPIYELIGTSDAQLLDDVRYTKIPVIGPIDSDRAHIYGDYYDLRDDAGNGGKGFSNDFSLYYPQMNSHRIYTDFQLKTIMNYYLGIAEELVNGYTNGLSDAKLEEILTKVYGEKGNGGIVMNNHIHPAPYGKDMVANLEFFKKKANDYRLNYLFNDMKTGKLDNQEDVQEIINVMLFGIGGTEAQLQEKFKSKNLMSLHQPIQGTEVLDFLQTLLKPNGAITLTQKLEKYGWPKN